MKKVIPKKGIVGFFDILGYRSFLENNDVEDAATVIVEFLTKLHKRVPKLAGEVFSETATEFRKPVDQIQWLVFSDTIVIVLPWSDENVDRFRFNEWVAFLMVAEMLGRMMFDYGLPLRGAITVGNFVLEGNCFAGKSLIESYHVASSLDLAATVLSQTAANDMKVLFDQNGFGWSHICQEYLIPKKGGVSEKHLVLSPTPCVYPLVGDIPQIVAESFWKHRKDVPIDALPKIRNTELFFRFVKMVHGHVFADEYSKHVETIKRGRKKREVGRKKPTGPA